MKESHQAGLFFIILVIFWEVSAEVEKVGESKNMLLRVIKFLSFSG